MIKFRIKNFSVDKQSAIGKPIIENDAATMTNVGRVGLQAAGGLGLLAGVEAGRSLYHGGKAYKDVRQLREFRKDPKLRRVAKKIIREQSTRIPVPGLGENVIEKIRFAEKNFPKFDKIDKINTAYKWWQRSSTPNRTVLNNLGGYTQKGVDEVISKYGNELGKEGTKAVKILPRLAARVGKMGVALKNAKGLGKAAAAVGSASGLLYLNGRSLETGKDLPKT